CSGRLDHGSDGHLHNLHGVVAEDVHHLNGQLAPPRQAFVEDADELKRSVLFGAKAFHFFSPVSPQDQIEKGRLAFFQLLFLLLAS
ncbi:MAG: hypothetical protein WCA08_25205, partial [Desulfoferrobacter sp.]